MGGTCSRVRVTVLSRRRCRVGSIGALMARKVWLGKEKRREGGGNSPLAAACAHHPVIAPLVVVVVVMAEVVGWYDWAPLGPVET